MKKIVLCLLLLCTVGAQAAEKLPDNMYFKAMQKEMDRSLTKLKIPGAPNIFYVAYKLVELTKAPVVIASLGELYPQDQADPLLIAYAWVDMGTPRHDSLGYRHNEYNNRYNYRPQFARGVAKSYEGIRQTLWDLTDQAAVFASETYQQKESYKRTKTPDKQAPKVDFIAQAQASYVEEIPPMQSYNSQDLQNWVKAASARGKAFPFLEEFKIVVTPQQKTTYYLNSLGGFYQYAQNVFTIRWTAQLRNKDGYKQSYSREIGVQNFDGVEQTLQTSTRQFLTDLQNMYNAVKGDTYLGPVLLSPQAAGNFLQALFVPNVQNTSVLLTQNGPDSEGGAFVQKQGMRVISNAVDLYDKPLWQTYQGQPLSGFTPVDDEGVKTAELALTQNGLLTDLPRGSRPFKNSTRSNGHARMPGLSLPREQLTNLFVEAKQPQTMQTLKEQLLAKCREWGLEYGYILYDFPTDRNGRVQRALRVYTQPGKADQWVYGLEVNNPNVRSLRDIVAAADNPAVIHFNTQSDLLDSQSIIAPGLLLEELELTPSRATPDKAPFVKKP